MVDQDEKFSHESFEDPASLARYLRALADAFEAGTVRLNSDRGGEVVLEPGNLLRFSVDASRATEREAFALRIEWSPRAETRGTSLEIRTTRTTGGAGPRGSEKEDSSIGSDTELDAQTRPGEPVAMKSSGDVA